MWAAGIIMYTMLTGSHPLYKIDDTLESYKDKVTKSHFNFPDTVSE